MSQSLFYWITYSYRGSYWNAGFTLTGSQSLFYWITYSYMRRYLGFQHKFIDCLNPYFIGLPILILFFHFVLVANKIVSILILLDYLFLLLHKISYNRIQNIVSILILLDYLFLSFEMKFDLLDAQIVSILILLDYLFL